MEKRQAKIPKGLVVGSSFSSFEDELKPLLDTLEEEQLTPFTVYCSVKIETYNVKKGRNYPVKLKYQSFTYACIHYGKRREGGKGLRPNQSSFKKECKARLRFCLDENAGKLVLNAINLEHNHDSDPDCAAFYPKNRKLDAEEAANAVSLMDLEVKPAILQNVIATSTHKLTTLQDLRNLQQFVRNAKQTSSAKKGSGDDSEMQRLSVELEEMAAGDPNATIIVGHQDDEIMYVFWASSEMKADFEAFPEVISVDSTYNTNNAQMPVTLFMSQNKHGNGRLVGVAIMRDEKRETLKDAISCFNECYETSINKVRSVFVDKSLNEISRIWEVMPHVDIHLCRFHCVEIFKRESKIDPRGKEVSKLCQSMLYTETAGEYEVLEMQLFQVCGEDFKKYFIKNWQQTCTIWKGHDRLAGVTFGLTTTNCNESIHGKIKSLLNRKVSVSQCLRKIRLFHSNFNMQAAYKDFVCKSKVHYVANNKDPAIEDICQSCTPFVSSLIQQQLQWSYKMDALPSSASIDCDKCTCGFYRSRKFPCCHIFFSRRQQNVPLFTPADVPPKWRRVQQGNYEDDVDGDLLVEGEHEQPPPLVLVPSCPVKVGGKPLTKAQKYTKFLNLCAQAGNLASLCGGNQYLQRCSVIEAILKSWESNVEVAVVPLSKNGASAGVGVTSTSEPLMRPSVIVQGKVKTSITLESADRHASPGNETGSGEKNIEDGPGRSETLSGVATVTENSEKGSGEKNIEDGPGSTETSGGATVTENDECGPPCKCGLISERYVPKYGKNRGRTCFVCPKKLPRIPCGFFTVNPTTGIQQDGELLKPQEVNAEHLDSKGAGGISRIQIASASDVSKISNMNLPSRKIVVGQPKMGSQRVFKKATKPWTMPKNVSSVTDRETRRQKGLMIPDNAVTNCGLLKWTVASQSSSSSSYSVEKILDESQSCQCDFAALCIHCFGCNCNDFKFRKLPCKHVYKVQQIFIASLEDEEEAADFPGEAEVNKDGEEELVLSAGITCHNDPQDTFNENEDVEEDCSEALMSLLAEVDKEEEQKKFSKGQQKQGRKCDVCLLFGPPSPDSAHKCAKCSTPVHAIGCSTTSSGGQEGYGGNDRLCWNCFDMAMTLPPRANLHLGEASFSQEQLTRMDGEDSFIDFDSKSQDKGDTYTCYGCSEQRVRRVSKQEKTLGREFFACPNPQNKCKQFFWAPSRANTTVPSPSPKKNRIDNYFTKVLGSTTGVELSPPRINTGQDPDPSPILGQKRRPTKLLSRAGAKKMKTSLFQNPPVFTNGSKLADNVVDSYVKNPNFHLNVNSLQVPWVSSVQDINIGTLEKLTVLKFTLNKCDLMSLEEKGWINDIVLDCFLEICIRKFKKNPDATIFRMDCLALESISKGLHNIIERVEKNLALYNDIWIVPSRINQNHWVLFLVLVKARRIIILNSLYEGKMLSPNLQQHLEILRLLINRSQYQCSGKYPDWTEWTIYSPFDTFKQLNGYDCGIFVCIWAYSLCCGICVPYDMFKISNQIRKWILESFVSLNVNVETTGDDSDGEVEFLSQMDPTICETTPWEDLPAAEVSFSLIDNTSTSTFLGSVTDSLFEATEDKCGAPAGCRVTRGDMYLCELCREYFHLVCISDGRSKPQKSVPYLCPLHPHVNTRTRKVTLPLRWRKSL